ncbi:MAG: formate dehydrogenase accessory sulfurtransferase FdhD [Paucibacter sp.]|nr:formate dehydrogenase accessory sulfurtransferase FdhD [Roseateles sp.]
MTDLVAVEAPVALVFNGISHAVMMATPTDLEAFALGFALSEGLLERPSECYGIDVAEGAMGCEVQLEVSAAAERRLKERRRNLAGRTGCGLCGIDSLQALDLAPPPLDAPLQIELAAVHRAFEQLPALQLLNAQSGAHHAAGWSTLAGELLVVMEDVGRHNALDKLLGSRVRAGAVLEDGFVIMSSRASSELVLKCARLRVPLLATISAPTSMAIQIAKNSRLVLYGWCRGERAVRFA